MHTELCNVTCQSTDMETHTFLEHLFRVRVEILHMWLHTDYALESSSYLYVTISG